MNTSVCQKTTKLGSTPRPEQVLKYESLGDMEEKAVDSQQMGTHLKIKSVPSDWEMLNTQSDQE